MSNFFKGINAFGRTYGEQIAFEEVLLRVARSTPSELNRLIRQMDWAVTPPVSPKDSPVDCRLADAMDALEAIARFNCSNAQWGSICDGSELTGPCQSCIANRAIERSKEGHQ